MKRWFPVWAFPLLVTMAIVTVWLRLSIVRTTYAIDQSEKQIRELQQTREQTELKVTALRSPRRLEVLARSKYGLTQPKAEQIIHMRSSRAP